MDRVAFIINPHSAKRNYVHFLEELQNKVHTPLYLVSKSIDDTNHFIDEHFDRVDIFVAVGGDGTISTIAKKLVHTDKILAIFPVGSGNGFSNETKFSTNLNELLLKIERRNYRKIDTFTINDHISINVSGAGFDGEIIKKFERTKRGFTNYIKLTISTFFISKTIHVNFEEPHKKYDGDYLMINIANTRQYGNNAYIAPHARISDGLVDVVLVKKLPYWYCLIFALQMFTKTLRENKYLMYFPVSELTFSINSKSWHLDGEYTRVSSPVKVKVFPRSLKVLSL